MPTSTEPWWKGATIYQIYPRSFRDSNGDGVGDLKGVIDGLDHIADLGVDGVWLSPFFTSPMDDFGYDVSDYCNVDPIFGTLKTFDTVIEKAHRLGLKVIIDQVYAHTSDRHPWFAESRGGDGDNRRDWYVWQDPKADGTPPNNWLSVFGGPAWTFDGRRGQYYLHHFLASQPALNLRNPAVQSALFEVARFWLDRGVDGFRLDAVNFAMHDPARPDNPPAPLSERRPARLFDYQQHLYDKSHPDIVGFLEGLRQVLDKYGDIFTVAEVVGADPVGEMRAFTTGRRLSTAYSFDFLYAKTLTPARLNGILRAWPSTPQAGWPAWAFSNHDTPRAVSRWARAEDRTAAAKLYALLLLSLRGNIFLYQGEELGLPQAEVPFEALKDPEAIANWPHTLGRDGARTPMPWRSEAPYAGFSGAEPWLPLDARHAALAADAQEGDPDSMLRFIRELIFLRKSSPALRLGKLDIIDAPDLAACFVRSHENETVVCAFNLGAAPIDWTPPAARDWRVVLAVGNRDTSKGTPGTLPPYGGYLARKPL